MTAGTPNTAPGVDQTLMERYHGFPWLLRAFLCLTLQRSYDPWRCVYGPFSVSGVHSDGYNTCMMRTNAPPSPHYGAVSLLAQNFPARPHLAAYAHFGFFIRNQREISPLYSTKAVCQRWMPQIRSVGAQSSIFSKLIL